jgi:hypothetical protein
VIDELKTIKHNNYIKEIDDDCDSDAHDDNEDFEHSKMKEFNNLLKEVALKTNEGKRKKPDPQDVKTERGKDRSETLNNLENLEEELRFFSELEEVPKPLTMQAEREKKQPEPRMAKLPSYSKKEVKNSLEFKRTQIYRTAVLTQQRPREKKETPATLLAASLEKKVGSESELRREPERTSYFGEYHLYVEAGERKEERPTHPRSSLFQRDKSRKSRKSHMDESRFMSETFLEKPSRPAADASAQLRMMKLSPPRSNHYEFKFDEIETVLVAKEKFKEYYRSKVGKSTRNSVIGPASFYGIRQNLNLKINKKKFFSQEQQDAFNEGRDSIKIIKFT